MQPSLFTFAAQAATRIQDWFSLSFRKASTEKENIILVSKGEKHEKENFKGITNGTSPDN